MDQGQESESERKEKFLKYLERSSNEVQNGDFNITHIPADEAKSYKLNKRDRSKPKMKTLAGVSILQEKSSKLEDKIEQLDLESDPQNFLKMEDYDMSQINEYQRQLNSHFDYEKLNDKALAPVDEKALNDQFKKDSVQNKETVIKMVDRSEKGLDWQNI